MNGIGSSQVEEDESTRFPARINAENLGIDLLSNGNKKESVLLFMLHYERVSFYSKFAHPLAHSSTSYSGALRAQK